MSRRPGRPPLDRADPSTKVCLALPSKGYDALYRRASIARVSVPELIRQSISGQLRYPKSPERDRDR
jgi:hypothetical protein